jgi:hypothetical protein
MAILGKILNCTKGDFSSNCDRALDLDFAADVQANHIRAKIEISSPVAAPTLPHVATGTAVEQNPVAHYVPKGIKQLDDNASFATYRHRCPIRRRW